MKSGDALLFDNQRVLHGRTGYELEDPPRSVLTSSVDLEEFHSSMRLLQSELKRDAPPMDVCQGMAV